MNISNKLAQSICKWLNVNSSINRYALKNDIMPSKMT